MWEGMVKNSHEIEVKMREPRHLVREMTCDEGRGGGEEVTKERGEGKIEEGGRGMEGRRGDGRKYVNG